MISLGAGQYTPDQIRSAVRKSGGPEGLILAIASNTAKISGQMIDDQTEITGAVASNRTLVFYIRLVSYEKGDIANIDVARQRLAKRNAPAVCTATVASILINEHGAQYRYMAYSKSREYLFDYTFNKVTCSPSYRW